MARRGKSNADESTQDETGKTKLGAKGVKPTEAIAKRASQMLAKPAKSLRVKDLEDYLLKRFPADDAQDWDRTGMLVGEGALTINKVAIALDPTVQAISEAARIGADVLVTHHPLFLEAPDTFRPESSPALASGAGVWAAIQNHISVMSFHTALDVSRQAQLLLPNMLGFLYKRPLSAIGGSKSKGFGQICKVEPIDGKPQSLAQISAKCTSVFGRAPRVWGDADKDIECVITFGGSAGSFVAEALASDADAIICGEMGYHKALDLKEAGMAVIELGHDASELPLLAVLARSISDAGIDEKDIIVLDQSSNWWYPESIRL